jgi:hypothetical protein
MIRLKIIPVLTLLAGIAAGLGMTACGDSDSDRLEEKVFLNIEIAELPTKTTYRLGETPDFTGLAINNVFTNGTREPNTYYIIQWNGNPFKRGKSVATVVSRNRTATFDILFEEELIDTGLPVVYIKTHNQQVIDSKENYVNATMVIKTGGNILHENTLRIRGRGNATWTYPKKPYKLKLDSKADLLGMGEDKDWTLLASYCDKSLMRTSIAFKLSRLLNFPWTPKDRFVELVLNGEYIGNYQLTESIKQDVRRVNIPKDGYMIERNGYYQQEPIWFVTPRGFGYTFKHPDPEDLSEEQLNYIRKHMLEFEAALASEEFRDPLNGYAKYIDTESFVRWFLFQQILANIDTNIYLTKDDNSDSKLFMGPVWDFEWSLGIGWYEGARPRPENYLVVDESSTFYYNRLLQDPAFTAKVKEQWQQIHVTQDILQHIDDTQKLLEASQQLNFRRWEILNERVSVGGIPLGSYEEEVACDRQFFINHITWLETVIPAL